MKKIFWGISGLLLIALTGCGASTSAEQTQQAEQTSAVEESLQNTVSLSEADLPVQPEYGPNPEYDTYTTISYVVEDLGQTLNVTISARKDYSQFEIMCTFFDDTQRVLVNYDGTDYTITEDRTGFMSALAPDMVKQAMDQDLWLPVSDSSVAYVDIAEIDANAAPPAIETGIWEEEFVRSNENLNGLPYTTEDDNYQTYLQPYEEKGTIDQIQYDTYFYAYDDYSGNTGDNLLPLTKTAYVYLPAGYNEENSYNVLYLLHGGGDHADTWFSMGGIDENLGLGNGYAVNILDNLIARGDIDPCIVVTPGIYDADMTGIPEEVNEYIPESFGKELRDLMVAVESTYSTYAADTTDEGLISSRDHRGMAGLSMGSITTWKSGIAQNLDRISWFANMSAGPSSDAEESAAYIDETIWPAIQNAGDQGYPVNMQLNFNGSMDIALDPHIAAHQRLLDHMEDSDLLTVGENYDFICSDGTHSWPYWQLYLYDLMKVFFR